MKKLISLIAFFGFVLSSQADIVSVEQAQSIAQRFFSLRNKPVTLTLPTASSKSKAYHCVNADDYYVFNAGIDEGFIIVAADDNVTPVLGYADHGTFCYDSLPPGLEAMLCQYSDMVNYVRSNDMNPIVSATHPEIKPMITSTWGQSEPYNQACPTFFNGAKSITGCVALAMGQVMRYHGRNSYKCTQAQIPSYQCQRGWTGYGHINVSSIPAQTPISWNEMPDNFGTSSVSSLQKKAVANMLYYCGAAVKMDYADNENGGSSAYSEAIPDALKRYFGYKKDARIVYRSDYTSSRWDEIIYNELANKRPVILSGVSPESGGHAFICDGYDGNDHYHINWGWSGNYDGYFLLGNLAPENFPEGFNLNLDAIVGIEPPTPSDVNHDNKVNSADVIGVYNYIQLGNRSGLSSTVADVNQDKSVNGTDVVSIYNDIVGDAKSKSSVVFDGVKATGNAYYTYPAYYDAVTIKNNLSNTISIHSIDLYRNGKYTGSYTVGRTLSPGETLKLGTFKFTIQYVGTYTTKLNYFYQGETYEKEINTPPVYAK